MGSHKNVAGCRIVESCNKDDTIRRFTASIRGWRNWVIYEGKTDENTFTLVIQRVKEIRNRIDDGDESVFCEVALRDIRKEVSNV